MFALISREALAAVEASERAGDRGGAHPGSRLIDPDLAVARVTADYARWSRLGLGMLAVAGGLAGIFLATTIGIMLSQPSPDPAGDLVVALLVGTAALGLLVPSLWVLLRLHRTGKRLARSAAYWASYPYVAGQRVAQSSDWLDVRLLVLSKEFFPRLFFSVIAGLGAIFLATVAAVSLTELQSVQMAVGFFGGAILCGSVAAGLMGGIMRIQHGHSPRGMANPLSG